MKKDFELFLKTLDMADKSCRENSLKVFAEMYTLLGEDIWTMLKKDIPIKVKGLLEGRFKQVAKNPLTMSMGSSGRNTLGNSLRKNNIGSRQSVAIGALNSSLGGSLKFKAGQGSAHKSLAP